MEGPPSVQVAAEQTEAEQTEVHAAAVSTLDDDDDDDDDSVEDDEDAGSDDDETDESASSSSSESGGESDEEEDSEEEEEDLEEDKKESERNETVAGVTKETDRHEDELINETEPEQQSEKDEDTTTAHEPPLQKDVVKLGQGCSGSTSDGTEAHDEPKPKQDADANMDGDDVSTGAEVGEATTADETAVEADEASEREDDLHSFGLDFRMAVGLHEHEDAVAALLAASEEGNDSPVASRANVHAAIVAASAMCHQGHKGKVVAMRGATGSSSVPLAQTFPMPRKERSGARRPLPDVTGPWAVRP